MAIFFYSPKSFSTLFYAAFFLIRYIYNLPGQQRRFAWLGHFHLIYEREKDAKKMLQLVLAWRERKKYLEIFNVDVIRVRLWMEENINFISLNSESSRVTASVWNLLGLSRLGVDWNFAKLSRLEFLAKFSTQVN